MLCVPYGWWWAFRLSFATAEPGNSMELRAPCSAKQLVMVLCLPPSPVGLGSVGETRHCFPRAGICIKHKVRAVALAYVTDMPPETQKPRCLIPVRVPDLLKHTEVCTEGGVK